MLGRLKGAGYALRATGPRTPMSSSSTPAASSGRPARRPRRRCRGVLRLKRRDPAKRIVAAGCYVERDRARLERAFPGVDAWIGVGISTGSSAIVEGRAGRGPGTGRSSIREASPRLVSTPGAWAYVKISEGCSHRCAFCAIPLIKGPYVSRSPASIVREAGRSPGRGQGDRPRLPGHDLVRPRPRPRGRLGPPSRRLARIEGVAWIRFLYGYPEEIDDALLEAMTEPKVCRYLDIPFQHADPGIVKAMRRGMDGARALRLLEKIRTKLPGVAVRTSLIVGFPGEGRTEFAALRRFVREARFDHLGVFTYSPEAGTPACRLADTVGPEEKEARRAEIMEIQAGISAGERTAGRPDDRGPRRRSRAGGDGPMVGRGRFQAPEVDGIVRFALPAGLTEPPAAIVGVEITSSSRL